MSETLRARLQWFALLLLCAAYLQGGLNKVLDWPEVVGEAAYFGLPLPAVLAALTILTELVGSALVLSGRLRWLGALGLGGFTLVATFIANRFWTLPPGHERFMAANGFFEHLGLVGGFLYVALHDLAQDRRRTRGAALCGALLLIAAPTLAQPDPAFRVHRFDEDFTALADPARRADALDALKYIGLGPTGAYLSLGGELRERYEWTRNGNFGIGRPPGASQVNDYLLQRALLHADLHLNDALRVFVQLGSFNGFGARRGTLSTTQDDRSDVVQAFGDLALSLAPDTRLTLRGGRQEMAFGSGRLVSEREGPNLRRAFDGGRAIFTLPGDVRVDAFVTRPVLPLRDSFDDRTNQGEALWGAYATFPVPALPGLSADLYYFGTEREGAAFAQGTGFEQRHTLGVRGFGRRGAWDWDTEGAWQFGTFQGAAIRAWTLASDTGFTLASLPWQPRLGLKADIASGDSNLHDGTLGTFNALYPKVPYFTEAGLVAPANIIDVFPSIRVQPTPAVTLELGWDLLWRQTTADAFYRPVPFAPVSGTAGGGSAWVGHQVQLFARWNLDRRVELRAWLVHFTAGDTLTRAGGRDVDFVAASVAFKF